MDKQAWCIKGPDGSYAPDALADELEAAMGEDNIDLFHVWIDEHAEQVLSALRQSGAGKDSNANPPQLPPLTDAMYHAVRGFEYNFSSGGAESVTGYLDDDCLDEIWEAINTALRVQWQASLRGARIDANLSGKERTWPCKR